MACRDAYEMKNENEKNMAEETTSAVKEPKAVLDTERLLFGVDSKVQADDILQNNLTEFEWVTRNKLYPNFWGRNITGENCLTKEEIIFLHRKGCKIAVICGEYEAVETEEQGKIYAKKIALTALELGILETTAIFMEINESDHVTKEYMKGFAQEILSEGYIPGFKANTDANYSFDREYSGGMQESPELFRQCLIWATAPSLKEYEKITTTHLIHPDSWGPYAPSGTTRQDIAVWQYGRDCHPIHDNEGTETSFHINLVKDENVILDKMF